MLNKKILYNQAKIIAEANNLPRPAYVGSSIESLNKFIRMGRKLPYLDEIKSRVPSFKFMRGDLHKDIENYLEVKIRSLLKDNNNYYFIFLDESNKAIKIRKKITINKQRKQHKPYYNLHTLLTKILNNYEEYQINPDYIIIQIHQQIITNPELQRQRDGDINCACKVVIDHLSKNKSTRHEYKIKHIKKINEEYFKTGINDTGLQKLADKSQFTLIIKDKIGEIWREFKPNGKDTKQKKLILLSHNDHISEVYDEDDKPTKTEEYNTTIDIPLDYQNEFTTEDPYIPDDIEWFDTTDDLVDRVNKYEKDKTEGKPIISKGELVAYITKDTVFKKKFYEYEKFQMCFTDGSVGKSKFKQELENQGLKHLIEGVTENDPFYNILIQADKSGFYSRTGESNENNFKYDQNKAYKSFSKSKIFNGFPILEAIFKVDKPFSLPEI